MRGWRRSRSRRLRLTKVFVRVPFFLVLSHFCLICSLPSYMMLSLDIYRFAQHMYSFSHPYLCHLLRLLVHHVSLPFPLFTPSKTYLAPW